ncbi:hypothetical protein B0I35DRAFT_419237 [Stachybotrys elegans]|uniref:Uncharacterized protein n=1 Tax=Stachybotrys elegans TaxID=80388 RepID=A0A8K0SZP8_9HYPO|nr:hypothetical protein B0I35DRAFT_419237 [Stachybotrys elegans]
MPRLRQSPACSHAWISPDDVIVLDKPIAFPRGLACLTTRGGRAPNEWLGNGEHLEIDSHIICDDPSRPELRVTFPVGHGSNRYSGAVNLPPFPISQQDSIAAMEDESIHVHPIHHMMPSPSLPVIKGGAASQLLGLVHGVAANVNTCLAATFLTFGTVN